jgi:hypothetical protein
MNVQAWAQDAGGVLPATTDIRGVVSDENGNPAAGATVAAHGPTDVSTTTDANGSYDLHVLPGVYRVVVSKSYYQAAIQNALTVTTRGAIANVSLVARESDGLREIGRVEGTSERSHFNTSPAAVQTLTTQDFDDQGRTSLSEMLDEIPGVSTVTAGSGSYASGLGLVGANSGWVNPQIRGAFSYETAQQFDGFPLLGADANAGFNAGLIPLVGLSSIDIIKGPGAESTTINGAVGGSINYRSIQPTEVPKFSADVSTDGLGGSFWKATYTGTAGRLGYAFGYSSNNSPGVFGRGGGGYNGLWAQGNYAGTFTIADGGQKYLFPGCSGTVGCQTDKVVATDPTYLSYSTPWLMCCNTPLSLNDVYGEAAKLVYHLTPPGDDRNITIDAAYFGSSNKYEEGAYRGPTLFGGTFAPLPGLGYAGSIPAGSAINVPWYANSQVWLTKFQSTFEANLRGKIGPGNLHIGYLSLYQYDDYHSPAEGPVESEQVWGTIPLIPYVNGQPPAYGNPPSTGSAIGAISQVFNGQTVQFQQLGGYMISEYEHVFDWLADYRVPIGRNNIDFSWTQSQINPDSGSDNHASGGGAYGLFSQQEPAQHYNQLQQINNEFRLSATQQIGSKLTSLTSLYYNQYINRLSPFAAPLETLTGATWAFPTQAQIQGYINSFQNNDSYYMAPRQAFAYQLNDNTSLRVSLGGAIVPLPILALASGGNQPGYDPTNNWYTQSAAPVGLKPETSFGYDLGADLRFPQNQITVSTDLYLTTLQNQFFTHESYAGTYTDGTNPTAPLYATALQNLGHARYEGVELAVRRDVTHGFGFIASGYLERAYPYDLPSNFYTNPATGVPYSQNLGIISGQNFNNGGATGAPSGTVGPTFAIAPYAGGYGEISYHWGTHNSFIRFGATYYGKYNSYHAPPFFLLNASIHYALGSHFALQVTGDNLGNIYTDPFGGGYAAQVQAAAGQPVPEANGQYAFGPYLPVGPGVVEFSLQYR